MLQPAAGQPTCHVLLPLFKAACLMQTHSVDASQNTICSSHFVLLQIPGLLKLPDVGFWEHFTTLHYLDLSGCSSLASLPQGIQKLTALRTLNIKGCRSLQQLPDLQELSCLKSITMDGGKQHFAVPLALNSKARVCFYVTEARQLQLVPVNVTSLTIKVSQVYFISFWRGSRKVGQQIC
jgi:hypothetical protein